ncbi:hypothetical protein [Ornithinibacillus halophilus]|nr:hypothetical protein [Ornithinibacillus halophilus]
MVVFIIARVNLPTELILPQNPSINRFVTECTNIIVTFDIFLFDYLV